MPDDPLLVQRCLKFLFPTVSLEALLGTLTNEAWVPPPLHSPLPKFCKFLTLVHQAHCSAMLRVDSTAKILLFFPPEDFTNLPSLFDASGVCTFHLDLP